MTPTLAYLLGIVTLPGMLVALGAALYVADRVAGWWRAPYRQWSAWARRAGTHRAIAARNERVRAAYLAYAAHAEAWAYFWARWCPWWPA